MPSEDNQSHSTEARIHLLDRPASEAYLKEWQERLRDKPDDEARDLMALLVFRVNKEWLAIRVSAVTEVTPNARVHRVPHRTNKVLRGIVNVRGELQLAFSLRAMLGLDRGQAAQASARVYQRMIVLSQEGQLFVARVDEVMGVLHFEGDEMEEAPVTVSKALATFTRGLIPWRDGKIAVLDDQLLFHSLLNQHL